MCMKNITTVLESGSDFAIFIFKIRCFLKKSRNSDSGFTAFCRLNALTACNARNNGVTTLIDCLF